MSPSRQTFSCGACQQLRRKCNPDVCFWAPYFPPEKPEMFIKVYNTFKISYVKRILSEINDPDLRRECVRTLVHEAEARLQDPVYGCMGYISRLEQAVANGQRELASYVNVDGNNMLFQQMNYNNQHHVQHQQMMTVADQPSSSNFIYGAAGTTCQQTQMDPSSSASGLPLPFTSVAPLVGEQSLQQYELVGMETQENYAAVAATDHRQELFQLQQLDREQSSHDLMQQMVMGAHNKSSSSNYIYGAAGTTCQQTVQMDPSSSASGLPPPFTSVAPLIREQSLQQHEVGMETQENYAAVAATGTDHRQELFQLQQLDREQSSHDLMQQMVMGAHHQSFSSNYIYGAAGTTCQQTVQMDPSSSASGLPPPFTSVAPSQTQLIREQSLQQHEVGMETQEYYAAVAADYRQELLKQLQQLDSIQKKQLQQLDRGQSSHDILMQQQVDGRNATARSPEQHDPTAVPKAATNHGQELLNQLQQLANHDRLMQQQVHGRNATARSPEQHDPTAGPKSAHGPGFTDATAPGSTTETISWDSDEVEAALNGEGANRGAGGS